MKLTGERPMEGHTPDSLLALHDAGYREVISRLGRGRILDVGCGVGMETARFCGPDRRVVGVDYDPATAALAASEPRDDLAVARIVQGQQGIRGAALHRPFAGELHA